MSDGIDYAAVQRVRDALAESIDAEKLSVRTIVIVLATLVAETVEACAAGDKARVGFLIDDFARMVRSAADAPEFRRPH